MIPKPHRSPSAQFTGVNKWKRVKKAFLKGKADFQGYYVCNACGGKTLYPEVDHIIKRSVAPELKYEPSNFQILDHLCHLKKDSGMRIK